MPSGIIASKTVLIEERYNHTLTEEEFLCEAIKGNPEAFGLDEEFLHIIGPDIENVGLDELIARAEEYSPLFELPEVLSFD